MHRTPRMLSVGLARHLALAIPFIALGVTGCFRSGPTISKVAGKVTLNGQPFSQGVINFASASGFCVQGKLAADGTYGFHSQYGKGIPLGLYKISILPPPPDPRATADTGVPLYTGQSEGPAIPQKYRSFDTSGFTAEVREQEENRFDFEMKL